ncbi:DUF7009 family protein [Terriglobus aquaticus]|uniref:DUF7009 family protein n=1 Tax=Terriglobus aquaticus TaxID=940139 RepID=A0ABW9KKY0_9BACT|nr:hypothetical protein [Terriglobus aquaticus]
MKLRLAKNSLRLRVLRSEVAALHTGARLQETLCLGPDPSARFTYAIEQTVGTNIPEVRFTGNEILVSIPAEQILHWATSDQVGIYAQVETGAVQPIALVVEKDFACLDRSDADNADTYQNPNMTC